MLVHRTTKSQNLSKGLVCKKSLLKYSEFEHCHFCIMAQKHLSRFCTQAAQMRS